MKFTIKIVTSVIFSAILLLKLVQSVKEKTYILINFNTNYSREMKFVPISIDYCILPFDTLKFFLAVRLHGGSLPNINFFNVNSQI